MVIFDKNSPIGFFDSGVGGLSVYSRFKKLLPNENTLYFGDLAHLPYGNKSKEELISYAREILKFFKSKNVKAVVIACNTSSAQAYETVKNEFDFKIVNLDMTRSRRDYNCYRAIYPSIYGQSNILKTEVVVETYVALLPFPTIKCKVDKIVFGLEAIPDGGADYLPHIVNVKEWIPRTVGGDCRKEQYELFKEFLETHDKKRVGWDYANKVVKLYEEQEINNKK